jgi:hypothetical protein
MLAVIAIDLLRLLPLRSLVHAALLAAAAALAVSHVSTPLSAKLHWRT